MNTSHHKEFEKIIRRLSHRHQAWQGFADFCEMAAISLSNAMIKNDAREARYLEIVKRYTKDGFFHISMPSLLAAALYQVQEPRAPKAGGVGMWKKQGRRNSVEIRITFDWRGPMSCSPQRLRLGTPHGAAQVR